MDWTRRRFLWSTALVAAVTGCQQSENKSTRTAITRTAPRQQTTTVTRTSSTQSAPVPTSSPPDVRTTIHSKETDPQTGTKTETPPNTRSETKSGDGTERAEPTEEGKVAGVEQTDEPTEEREVVELEQTDEPADGQETAEPEPLHVGETIPQFPHAPVGTAPPTGANVRPSAATPVLRARDVTDYGSVDYVADPFMFLEAGTWHMFFEIVNEDRTPDAPIGHATSSDGLRWTYDKVVLTKRYHTSFPLVWKQRGDYYMCPPTGKRVELYKARRFPTDWRHIGNAIDVDYYPHDPTFVQYQGRWWLFTDRGNDSVMVYHSRDLEREGWTPHRQNPVVTDRLRAGRQGGRPMVVGDRLFLYFQDSVENYGDAIRCYELTSSSA